MGVGVARVMAPLEQGHVNTGVQMLGKKRDDSSEAEPGVGKAQGEGDDVWVSLAVSYEV